MAQLIRRYSDNNKSTPKTQTSPTFDHVLHGGDHDVVWASPSLGKNHDQEEFSSNKKSVLAKVKERAKKLRHSLSGRKKHGNELHDDNTTPTWGVSLEDEDEEEEDDDPEYLGAPMYESELAPETYKEYARQHPRAIPVVSENRVLPGNVRHKSDGAVKEKTVNPKKIMMGRSKSLKWAPKHATTTATNASDVANNTIASRFSNINISAHETQETVEKSLGAPVITKQSSDGSPQRWDKGVSVKEYFLSKLEPGDDEKALSQAIKDAISPKRTAGETGVVEMVKEAVTSFFRLDEISDSMTSGQTSANESSSATLLVSPTPATEKKKNFVSSATHSPTKLSRHTDANSSPLVPISTNALPVPEEEIHGRILQTN